MTKIVAYKGFDAELRCRGFQFELNKSFQHQGSVVACESGFHACEYPLDVFGYYPPASSRYGEVELSGDTSKEGKDTKIAAAEITIKAELKIPELIAAAVRYIVDRAKRIDGQHATGERELIEVRGDRAIGTVSGHWSAATASGDQGAATASGDWSAATATGYQGKVRGKEGCALFLVERNDQMEIIAVWAGVAGQNDIKPDTFYILQNGQPVETE